jgi:hypothetical protein
MRAIGYDGSTARSSMNIEYSIACKTMLKAVHFLPELLF